MVLTLGILGLPELIIFSQCPGHHVPSPAAGKWWVFIGAMAGLYRLPLYNAWSRAGLHGRYREAWHSGGIIATLAVLVRKGAADPRAVRGLPGGRTSP